MKSKDVTIDEINKKLDEGIAGADVQRAEHLRNFQTARLAKANLYSREQQRLRQKYGPDHPRVQVLTNKMSVNRGIITEVEQERVRAAIAVPQDVGIDFITHGIVRDENGIPVRNVTVAFYDRNGRPVQSLGFACTNGEGYFKIISSEVGSTTPDRVYLGVTQNGNRIYNDSRTITPRQGAVIYRELRLKPGGAVCPPPDDWGEPTSSNPNPTIIGGGGAGSGGTGGSSGGAGGQGAGGGHEGYTAAGAGVWTVRGRVTESGGRGAKGLTVSLYDEDLIFDDLLDETVTDDDGNYIFTYETEAFRDLIEKKPDLYIKVMDNKGRTLHDSECDVYFEAGRTEVIDIDLSE
ncbi:MAG: hypothetical protein JOZ52_06625 [Acidobacteria bacterium]|nr:hypothetical protein [Acidobacteriota bacterium]